MGCATSLVERIDDAVASPLLPADRAERAARQRRRAADVRLPHPGSRSSTGRGPQALDRRRGMRQRPARSTSPSPASRRARRWPRTSRSTSASASPPTSPGSGEDRPRDPLGDGAPLAALPRLRRHEFEDRRPTEPCRVCGGAPPASTSTSHAAFAPTTGRATSTTRRSAAPLAAARSSPGWPGDSIGSEVRGLAVAQPARMPPDTINDNNGAALPACIVSSGTVVVPPGDTYADRVALPVDPSAGRRTTSRGDRRDPADRRAGAGAARARPSGPSTSPAGARPRGRSLVLRPAARGIAGSPELDVDPRELRSACSPTRPPWSGGGVTRRIFVADRLENGAGYCQPARRAGAAGAGARPRSRRDRASGLRGRPRATGATAPAPTACAATTTASLHPLLDWRLGLDLAELAAAAAARRARWLADAESIARAVASAFRLQPGTIAGLPTLSDDGRPKTAVLCHPMWSAAERSRRLDGAVATTTGCPTSAASTSTPPSRSPTRSRSGCMRSEAPIGACGLPNAQKSCIKTRSMTSLPRRSR